MSTIPNELSYTKEHEWVSSENLTYTMGITDYAQAALGDIVYVQLPKIGQAVIAGTVCGEVESTKSVSEIYAPVTGTVLLPMIHYLTLLKQSTPIPTGLDRWQRSRSQQHQATYCQRLSTARLPLDLICLTL